MQQHLSTGSKRANVGPPMDNSEASLRPLTKKQSFYTEVKETQSDIAESSWEAVLKEECVKVPVQYLTHRPRTLPRICTGMLGVFNSALENDALASKERPQWGGWNPKS